MMITVNVEAKKMGTCIYHDEGVEPSLEMWFNDEVLVALQGKERDILQALHDMVEEVLSSSVALTETEIRDERRWNEGWGKL